MKNPFNCTLLVSLKIELTQQMNLSRLEIDAFNLEQRTNMILQQMVKCDLLVTIFKRHVYGHYMKQCIFKLNNTLL